MSAYKWIDKSFYERNKTHSFFVDTTEEMRQKLETVGIEFTTVTPELAVFKDANDIVIEMRLP